MVCTTACQKNQSAQLLEVLRNFRSMARGRSRSRSIQRGRSRSRSNRRQPSRSRSRTRSRSRARRPQRKVRSRSRQVGNRRRSGRSRSRSASGVAPSRASRFGFDAHSPRTSRLLGAPAPRVRTGGPSGRVGLVGRSHRQTGVAAGDVTSYKFKAGNVVGGFVAPPLPPSIAEDVIVQTVAVYPIIGKVPKDKVYGGLHLVFGSKVNDFEPVWGDDGTGFSVWLKGLEEARYFDWDELCKLYKQEKPIMQHTSFVRQRDYEGDYDRWDGGNDNIGFVFDVSWIDPSVSKDLDLITLKAKTLYTYALKR